MRGGRGRKGQGKGKLLPCVCVCVTHSEKRYRYMDTEHSIRFVAFQRNGVRTAEATMYMSEVTWYYYTRICKLKRLQCWIDPVNDWSWPGGNFGGNAEKMHCQRGHNISTPVIYLEASGRSQKFVFSHEILFAHTHTISHTQTTWEKKKGPYLQVVKSSCLVSLEFRISSLNFVLMT